jgi:hypothetical protein
MANIIVTMKDGTVRQFEHEGRAGGSYTKRLRHESGFVVIIDEWDNEIYIPAVDIEKIETTPHRTSF